MKKIVFFVLSAVVCAGSVCASDNYSPCLLDFVNGKSIECTAYSNIFGTFKYKLNPNDKSVSVKSSEVLFATFVENGDTVIISGMPTVKVTKAVKGNYKPSKSLGWIYFLTNPKTEKVALYYYQVSRGNGIMATVYGCCRMGDKYGVDLYYSDAVNRESVLRKAGSLYFKDCPDVVKYLNDKSHSFKKGNDFIHLVDEYNNCQK